MRRSSLLRQTLSDFRRPALWWGLGWLLFGLLMFILLPVLYLPGPRWLVDWLAQLAGESGTTSVGLLAGLGLGLILPIGLGVQAAWWGSQLLTVDREGGTLALLLASPMPRSRLFDAKTIAFLLLLVGQCLALGLVFEVCAAALGLGIPFGRMLIWTLHALLLGLIPGGVAVLTSAWGAGRKLAFGWGMLAMLLIILHNLFASLFPARWLADSSLLQLAADGGIFRVHPVGWHTLALLVVVLLLLLAARAAFSTRDLEI